jgi:hypothetical protein
MQNVASIQLKTKSSRTYFAVKTSKKWGILGNNESKLPLLSSTYFSKEFRDNFQKLTKYVSSVFVSPLKSAEDIQKEDFVNQFEAVGLDIERDIDNETGESIMTVSIKCLYESNKFETPLEISTPKQSSNSGGMFRLPADVEILVNNICEEAWKVVLNVGTEYEGDLFSSSNAML